MVGGSLLLSPNGGYDPPPFGLPLPPLVLLPLMAPMPSGPSGPLLPLLPLPLLLVLLLKPRRDADDDSRSTKSCWCTGSLLLRQPMLCTVGADARWRCCSCRATGAWAAAVRHWIIVSYAAAAAPIAPRRGGAAAASSIVSSLGLYVWSWVRGVSSFNFSPVPPPTKPQLASSSSSDASLARDSTSSIGGPAVTASIALAMRCRLAKDQHTRPSQVDRCPNRGLCVFNHPFHSPVSVKAQQVHRVPCL